MSFAFAGPSTPRQVRDNAVWDLIQNNQLKQAEKMLKKRIKKLEKDDGVQLLLLHVHIRQAEYEDKTALFEECKRLIERPAPLFNKQNLRMMMENLNFLLSSSTNAKLAGKPLSREKCEEIKSLIPTCWERSIFFYPFDEKIVQEYFHLSWTDRRWAGCNTAINKLKKELPEIRNYYFLSILVCLLMSLDHKLDEQRRELNKTIAYKMMSTSAAKTPSGPFFIANYERTLQSVDDVHLLIKVYKTAGRHSEAIEYLDKQLSETMDGLYDWNLVMAKVDLLDEQKRFQELWKLCDILLCLSCPETFRHVQSGEELALFKDSNDRTALYRGQSSRVDTRGDDGKVCSLYVRAALEFQSRMVFILTRQRLEDMINRPVPSENALIAAMDLCTSHQNPLRQDEDEFIAFLFSGYNACQTYGFHFMAHTCYLSGCSKYLRRLTQLERDCILLGLRNELIARAVDPSFNRNLKFRLDWLKISNNNIRLTYMFRQRSEAFDFSFQGLANLCTAFYLRRVLPLHSFKGPDADPMSLEEYESLKREHPFIGADPCILATLCQLQSLKEVNRYVSIVKAIVTLEHYVHQGSNAQPLKDVGALLVLSRLYQMIGAFSLAAERHQELGAKHTVSAALAHHLFTRVSTIHPREFNSQFIRSSGSRNLTDTTILKHLQPPPTLKKDFKNHVERLLLKGRRAAIAAESELLLGPEDTLSWNMFKVEQRRIARLLGKETVVGFPLETEYRSREDRDFYSIPNYEADGMPVSEAHLRPGPLIKAEWIVVFATVEHLIDSIGRWISSAYHEPWMPPMDGEQSKKEVRAQLRAHRSLHSREMTAQVDQLKQWATQIDLYQQAFPLPNDPATSTMSNTKGKSAPESLETKVAEALEQIQPQDSGADRHTYAEGQAAAGQLDVKGKQKAKLRASRAPTSSELAKMMELQSSHRSKIPAPAAKGPVSLKNRSISQALGKPAVVRPTPMGTKPNSSKKTKPSASTSTGLGTTAAAKTRSRIANQHSARKYCPEMRAIILGRFLEPALFGPTKSPEPGTDTTAAPQNADVATHAEEQAVADQTANTAMTELPIRGKPEGPVETSQVPTSEEPEMGDNALTTDVNTEEPLLEESEIDVDGSMQAIYKISATTRRDGKDDAVPELDFTEGIPEEAPLPEVPIPEPSISTAPPSGSQDPSVKGVSIATDLSQWTQAELAYLKIVIEVGELQALALLKGWVSGDMLFMWAEKESRILEQLDWFQNHCRFKNMRSAPDSVDMESSWDIIHSGYMLMDALHVLDLLIVVAEFEMRQTTGDILMIHDRLTDFRERMTKPLYFLGKRVERKIEQLDSADAREELRESVTGGESSKAVALMAAEMRSVNWVPTLIQSVAQSQTETLQVFHELIVECVSTLEPNVGMFHGMAVEY